MQHFPRSHPDIPHWKTSECGYLLFLSQTLMSKLKAIKNHEAGYVYGVMCNPLYRKVERADIKMEGKRSVGGSK
jgi:hypothetical protein